MMAGVQVKEGEYTTTIYGMVSNFDKMIPCKLTKFVDSGCSGTK